LLETIAIHGKIQNLNSNGLSGRNSLMIQMIIIVMTRNDCEDEKNNFEFKNGNYEKTKKL